MKDGIDIDLEEKKNLEELELKLSEVADVVLKQKIIREYRSAINGELLEFAKRFSCGANAQDNGAKFVVGKVTARASGEIARLIGADVADYSHVITAGTIRHIENRHGEQGQQDHSMADIENIARVGYVL